MKVPDKIAKAPLVWELRKMLLYAVFTAKALCQFKSLTVLCEAVAYFPLWWRHKLRDNNPLNHDRPWITFRAKEFLDTIVDQSHTVFEYGSGSSTLYFARRAGQVYSVEHDKAWFDYLCSNLLKFGFKNVDSQLIEPAPLVGDSQYTSSSTDFKNQGFEEYVRCIDQFPDNHFDIVVVDGRARNACIRHAVAKVKRNGYLIVDNSERTAYFINNEHLFDPTMWCERNFIGPTPYTFGFSKTSFFQKK